MKMLKLNLLVVCLMTYGVVLAQKPMPTSDLEIKSEETRRESSFHKNNMRIDGQTGHPIALYNQNFPTIGNSPEERAAYYIQANALQLGLSDAFDEGLKHHHTRSSDAGDVVRYRQIYKGLPVNKGEITVSMDREGNVQFVMNAFEGNVKLDNTRAAISSEDAIDRATIYIQPERLMMENTSRLMIFHDRTQTRLAHEVVILSSAPQGEWHVHVDAVTGEIFQVKNELHYYCGDRHHEHSPGCSDEKTATAAIVNGNGFVFDPDPLSSNMVAYGGNYSDNNDATNADLDNARFNVTLFDIEELGGVYKLKGPWAEIVDTDQPNTGLFTQSTSVFEFDRFEQGFEPVNCYYHIDFLMRYINDTLGCNIQPYQYTTGVRYDPHGANGADNSFYSTGSGSLTFGEGCVDDGEDSDVIHHELGHGLHDWVTAGGLSQVDGLSEGCGDYIAQSYNRSLGYWSSSDPAYNFVFNWDGHNPCWNGRTTAHTATYPGGLTGSIHTDGQIWATCLMEIWDVIGQQKIDKAFYEGLGMTNGSSSQDDAANAVYQAAINLGYSMADLTAIHNGFTSTGYTLPPLGGLPPTAEFTVDNAFVCLDNSGIVMFTDESTSNPPATDWAWTFEGGSPATSTSANPSVTYDTGGTYDVQLIVTNSNGSDTLNNINFITVYDAGDCPACESGINNTVVPISSSGANLEYTSVINISAGGAVTDVNVTNITGLHSFLSDLTFYLISPDSTVVQLNDDVCGTDEDFDVGFDDDAATGTLACPYNDGTIYIPLEPLSDMNGVTAAGDWTLVIIDDANLDGGELQSWSLEVCTDGNDPCVSDLTLPTVTTDTYQASNSILSNATVMAGDSAVFQAGVFAELQPDFEVELSGVLLIEITPCD